MEKYDVVIIGAGPSGLLAATRAAQRGAKVLVLEKMRSEGRKLLITGKGRCNITNDKNITEFIKHVHPNGRFLKPAFSLFYSKDILQLLEDQGVKTKLERGGRYYPESDKASDVLHALLRKARSYNVKIECNQEVKSIITENDTVTGVKAKTKEYAATNVVIATGGKSYPGTGWTGDGFKLAKNVGHSLIKPRPALVPLETQESIPEKLQTLTLKNTQAVVWVNHKKANEAFGEVTFEPYGLNGPIIITLSRAVVDALQNGQSVTITLDLKPALDDKKLDKKLLRDLDENGKKQVKNIIKTWLPSQMVEYFIERSGIDVEKACHQVTNSERKILKRFLKEMPFTITQHRSFDESIVTAGGIPTTEINQKTMESKLVKRLYFTGEVIDVDGETGGYNLQIAYSTGWLAGNCISL